VTDEELARQVLSKGVERLVPPWAYMKPKYEAFCEIFRNPETGILRNSMLPNKNRYLFGPQAVDYIMELLDEAGLEVRRRSLRDD